MNYNTNTGILIRFDDIAPNMNWEMMDKCQELLNNYNLKPVVGVIPNNKDKELLKYHKREDFWQHKVMEIYNKAHSPTVIPTNMAPKF